LQRAIDGLSKLQRTVLTLKVEGHASGHIAAITGKSPDCIDRQYRIVKETLLSALRAPENGKQSADLMKKLSVTLRNSHPRRR
jgi:hypothetical protein